MQSSTMTAKAVLYKRARPPEPTINVTPLVDVVLVLLIIFMVIAPNLQEGHPVVLPEVDTPDEKKLENALEVVLDAEGKLVFEEAEIDFETLAMKLEQARAADKERPLVLKADAGLPYGAVRDIFVRLQRGGFTNVSLKVATQRKEGS